MNLVASLLVTRVPHFFSPLIRDRWLSGLNFLCGIFVCIYTALFAIPSYKIASKQCHSLKVDGVVNGGTFTCGRKSAQVLDRLNVASTCARLHVEKAVFLRPLNSNIGGCIAGFAILSSTVLYVLLTYVLIKSRKHLIYHMNGRSIFYFCFTQYTQQ